MTSLYSVVYEKVNNLDRSAKYFRLGSVLVQVFVLAIIAAQETFIVNLPLQYLRVRRVVKVET